MNAPSTDAHGKSTVATINILIIEDIKDSCRVINIMIAEFLFCLSFPENIRMD